MTVKFATWLLTAVVSTFSSAALSNSVTVYRDTNFRGPAVASEEARSNMRLNFRVASIRIAGEPWQLCPEPNFRGKCLIVSQTSADLSRQYYGWTGQLQSMRPASQSGSNGGGSQLSLRGMASEFFPAPRNGSSANSARVQACPGGSATANCAAQNADRFCRGLGWSGSARELMETVNRRVYLADVLCVRGAV